MMQHQILSQPELDARLPREGWQSFSARSVPGAPRKAGLWNLFAAHEPHAKLGEAALRYNKASLMRLFKIINQRESNRATRARVARSHGAFKARPPLQRPMQRPAHCSHAKRARRSPPGTRRARLSALPCPLYSPLVIAAQQRAPFGPHATRFFKPRIE